MSGFKKRFFQGFLIITGLELYSYLYKSKLVFTFQPSKENIQIIKNCKSLHRVNNYSINLGDIYKYIFPSHGSKLDNIRLIYRFVSFYSLLE